MVEQVCRYCGTALRSSDDVAEGSSPAHAACVEAGPSESSKRWWRRAISDVGTNLAGSRGNTGGR